MRNIYSKADMGKYAECVEGILEGLGELHSPSANALEQRITETIIAASEDTIPRADVGSA